MHFHYLRTQGLSFLLVCILSGFPKFCEAYCAPLFPYLVDYLGVSENTSEYTLSIYLLGYCLGILFWGHLSDYKGRRPCFLWGVALFTIGAFLTAVTKNIYFFFLSRFLQAFGGATFSVLSHSIVRDLFDGKNRTYTFFIGSLSIAVLSGLGPIIGGYLSHYFGVSVALSLMGGLGVGCLVYFYKSLPESLKDKKKEFSLSKILLRAKSVLTNRKILSFSILISAGNGIVFSYLSEGPFFFTQNLGLERQNFGYVHLVFSAALLSGIFIGQYLVRQNWHYKRILLLTSFTIFSFSGFFTLFCHQGLITPNNPILSYALSGLCLFFIVGSINLSNPICLSNAFNKNQKNIGSAASVFNSFYYLLITLASYGMGTLHDGRLLTIYFFFLGTVMILTTLVIHQRGEAPSLSAS